MARAQRASAGPRSAHGRPRARRGRTRGHDPAPSPGTGARSARRSRDRRRDRRRRDRGAHHDRGGRPWSWKLLDPVGRSLAGDRRPRLARPPRDAPHRACTISFVPSRPPSTTWGSLPRPPRSPRAACPRARSRRCCTPIATGPCSSAPPGRSGSRPSPRRPTWCRGCSRPRSGWSLRCAEVEVLSTWWGVRPLSPDERPFVGAAADWPARGDGPRFRRGDPGGRDRAAGGRAARRRGAPVRPRALRTVPLRLRTRGPTPRAVPRFA